MFSSLDAEAKELDRMQSNVTAGSRLLQEKEDKLRQLEEALFHDQVRSILFVVSHVMYRNVREHLAEPLCGAVYTDTDQK